MMVPRETPSSTDPRRHVNDASAKELRGRIALAISLLEHRPPNHDTRALALEALYGVPLDSLVTLSVSLGEIKERTQGHVE